MSNTEKPKLPLLAKEYDTCERSYFVIEDGNECELSDEEFLWVREAANNHDRLTEENEKLREVISEIIDDCEEWCYNGLSGVVNSKTIEKINQLKEQDDDK